MDRFSLKGRPLLVKPTWKCCWTWLLPRLQADKVVDYNFHQEGSLLHWSLNVRKFVKTNLPNDGLAALDKTTMCFSNRLQDHQT